MGWFKRASLKKPTRRRFSFEQFESRRLMAVTTSLSSGTLTVTGDAGADDIAIVGTANAGEITVTGRNGTLVDGVANGSTTISGVTAHLNADFGDGDNVINVDNVYLAGHLDLSTGAGADRVVFGASGVVSTAQHCYVATGDGSDVMRAEAYKVFIVGQLLVSSADGASVNLVGASSLASIDILAGSTGRNEIILRGVTAGSWLHVHALAPINNVAIFTSATSANLWVNCASGQNSVYVDTCYAAKFVQVTTVSSDSNYVPQPPVPAPYNIDATVTVARCQTPQIVVRTGGVDFPSYFGGNDTVYLYGNNIVGPPTQVTVPTYAAAHVVYVETGDGADTLTASYNVARGDVFLSLSQLDDTLTLVGNLVTGFTSADGGLGTNRLNLFGNQFGGFASSRFQ